MNLYLAGEHEVKNGKLNTGGGQKILESYFTCRDNPWVPKLIPRLDSFLLDSGAYTFLMSPVRESWETYLEGYAEYINQHGVDLFFELDIDPIVGLKEVERMRAKLERLTGKQPIPVWHISRGLDYFEGMCKDYKYVAYGGLYSDGVSTAKLEKTFPWFINKAHENGAKIHGLGYTRIEGLHKYHFDSVDSTAWLYGNRGGYLYIFNPKSGTMAKKNVPPGHRLNPRGAALHNFNEWVKFSAWAERYL